MNAQLIQEGQRVLVVNDEPTQLLRTCRILEKQGLEVKKFSNGADLVGYLGTGDRADLLVTDLHMPGVDGWKLCRLIRSKEYAQYNDTPILATSAIFCGEEAQSLAAGLGANALLPAPFTAAELIRCARELLLGARPSIRTKVLILPEPGKSYRGLASSFSRFGYNVFESDKAEAAIRHLESWKPEVIVAWGGHPSRILDAMFKDYKQGMSYAAIIVVLDEGSETSHVEMLKNGADGCIMAPFESDYVVGLAEKMSRVRALLRLQELLEARTEELRSAQNSFKCLFECVPDPALIYDRKGRIIAVNESCSARLASRAAKLVGRKIEEVILADELGDSLNFGWGDSQVGSYTAECVTHSGGTFEAEVYQSPVRYNLDWATLVVLKHLPEKLVTQATIRANESSGIVITENTYDWEFWCSPLGHFLYSSPACKKISGYDAFEFEMDVNFLSRIAHPDDSDLVPKPQDHMTDETMEAEFRIIDRSGSTRWVVYKSRPVYDESGSLLGFRGAIRDLTRNKELENEKERLVAAVEQFTDAIAITDLNGRLEYMNSAFGGSHDLGQGFCLGDVYDMVKEPPIQEAISQGEVWSGRRRRQSAGEGERVVEVTMSPVRDSEQRVRELVWSERDITDQVALHERLKQAQRMEAIGTLAGGVAHDFNNLLSGILGYSSLLKGAPTSWQETQQAAEVIEKAARRAADLTQKLLGFARQGKHKHDSFSLHESISEVLTLLSRTTDKRILIEGILDAENPRILGDSGQIGQVLLNLAINATHALEQGGQLTISTRNVSGNEVEIIEPSGDVAGEYIEIVVKDSGSGISAEHLSRIFEPFFTTKENGSGLGLAMVYGIVQTHEGAITVKSKIGEGTSFYLYFPCQQQFKAAPAPVKRSTPVGIGTILVVDDEEIVRNIASKMLRRIGYEVFSCSDGVEAVEFYTENYKTIDLVIIDMIMPRMDGRECFRAMLKINPELRAILSSGYSRNQTVQEILDEGLMGYIGKPFEFQEIADLVARVMSDENDTENDE